MPTVFRTPRFPTVTLAPLGPNDVDRPDLLRLIVTPGAILIRRNRRKYPIARRMDRMSSGRCLAQSTAARIFLDVFVPRPLHWMTVALAPTLGVDAKVLEPALCS